MARIIEMVGSKRLLITLSKQEFHDLSELSEENDTSMSEILKLGLSFLVYYYNNHGEKLWNASNVKFRKRMSSL